MTIKALLSCTLLAAALPAHAGAITWTQSIRARIEAVDQDGFEHDALAPTARLRLGALLAPKNLRPGALVEFDALGGVGDHYNSGANGETAYPVVTDPNGTEINQATVFWREPDWSTTVGRQRLIFDNQRFIGNAGWRQNEQTFDAFDATRKFGSFEVRYAYLDRVHRVAGDHARAETARERNLAGHALHLGTPTRFGALAGYAYLIEDDTVRAASSQTFGVRWTSPAEQRIGWTVELAHQSDYDNPNADFSHPYYLLEANTAHAGVTWRGGWEQLRGDGQHALQTPLASLHAFNGWADVFTVTPTSGLDDRYVSASGTFGAAKTIWVTAVHRFAATEGNARYGSEFDASLARPLGAGWTVLGKVALYNADDFATDTSKLWLQFEWVH